jgi:hypothetical protein
MVRRLGAGTRAEVWLGRHGAGEGDDESAGVHGGPRSEDTSLVAIKVYRSTASSDEVDAEISMLASIESEHVIPILDIAMKRDHRPSLVLPRLDPNWVSHRLASEGLTSGESVTLLVSLARAVSATHNAGFAHGDLRLTKLLLTSCGTPVLLGSGNAAATEKPATRVAQRGSRPLLDDRRQLATLALSVVGRGDPSQADAFDELERWLRTEAWHEPDFAEKLVERAFDAAPAAPLAAEVHRNTSATPGPDRLAIAAGPPDGVGTARRRRDRTRMTSVRGLLRRGLTTGVNRVVGACRAFSAIRARFKVIAVAIVLMGAGTGLILLQPSLDDVGNAVSSPMPIEPSEPTAATDPPADDGAAPEPDQAAEPRGDSPDVAIASPALLALREECLRSGSTECLELAVQKDSAAWRSDAAQIAEIRGGSRIHEPVWADGSSVAVIDSMGAVVLLAIEAVPAVGTDAETSPASVLMIRTEAGWRIRDVFVD